MPSQEKTSAAIANSDATTATNRPKRSAVSPLLRLSVSNAVTQARSTCSRKPPPKIASPAKNTGFCSTGT